ncbi:MAG: nucleotidyltransferase domain-containing protein [bacterium]|jgi:predicted nucleotidyltransferase
MDEILAQLVQRIVETVDPEKIILFGSRCRGELGSDGDYDLLVLKEEVKHKRRMMEEIYKNIADIPAPVDIILETPSEAEKYRDVPGLIYYDALRGVVVYEK